MMQHLNLRQKASRLVHIGKALFRQHHRELAPIFASYIRPDSIIIDVGAHSGQFTKLFAAMVPQGHVFAFEPSHYARSILKKVVRAHRLKNVSVLAAGLSDQAREQILHIPVKKRGSVGFGLSSLGRNEQHEQTIEQKITLWTLDQFILEQNLQDRRIDFIKADIEGWEARLLMGAEKIIATHKPTIYLEIDHIMLKRADSTPEQIWTQLTAHGYHSYLLDDSGLMTACTHYEGIGNYLFTTTDKNLA